jgi:serine/threonine-protein kinase
MRDRSGGQFADAVAAVRSGRRPPRPNSAPTIKATPAAIPGAKPPRAAVEAARAAAAARPRTTAGHRSPPPARRAFSSGQRALLWAAGVLGALAIISAILIVLADRERRSNAPVEQTVTDTVTPDAPGAPPAAPSGWTGQHSPGPDAVPATAWLTHPTAPRAAPHDETTAL